MTLDEAVKQLDMLGDDATLFVRRPWAADAECLATALDEELRVPQHVKDAGFHYFLEVSLAREVFEVFEETPPTNDERVSLLLYYAENDAYPEWVYQR